MSTLTSFIKRIDPNLRTYRLFIAGVITLLFPFIVIRLLCILIKHRRLLSQNPVVLARFRNVSFGHQIQTYENLSRLFSPYRGTIFAFSQPRMNPYLHLCYPTIDTVLVKSWHLKITMYEQRIMHNLCLLASLFTKSFTVIDSPNVLYKLMSQTDSINKTNPNPLTMPDHTSSPLMFELGRGITPSLPEHLKAQCETALNKLHPNLLSKPFVTLFHRAKGKGKAYNDAIRNPGDQRDYIQGIKDIISRGYHVVGWAGTDDSLFEELDGYFNIRNCDVDPKLLNLYIIMHAALFITQHSGPYILANASNVPVVICDAFPFYHGTYKASDIVLHKRPIQHGKSAPIPFYEWYTQHPEKAIHTNLPKIGFDVLDNTETEITAALNEAVDRLSKEWAPSERHHALIEAYRQTVPQPNTLIYYEKNVPPLFILEEMADQLLSPKT